MAPTQQRRALVIVSDQNVDPYSRVAVREQVATALAYSPEMVEVTTNVPPGGDFNAPEGNEIVIMISGENLSPDRTAFAVDYLRRLYPDIGVTIIN